MQTLSANYIGTFLNTLRRKCNAKKNVVHATSGDIVIGTGLSKDKVLRLMKNLINNGYVNVSGLERLLNIQFKL